MTSILLLLLLAAPGQQVPPSSAPPSSEPSAAATLPASFQTSDYQLGPGDVVSIHVSGLRQFDQTTRVSNSGRIHVPYVGIMLVAGMTPVQIEQEVARLIKEHELVNEPTVRVQLEQQRSQPAYVIGEVNAPGQFIITSEMYLLDLLSKAGGLLGTASEKGFLYRRNSQQPSVETRIVMPGAASAEPAAVNPSSGGKPPAADAQPALKREEVVEINFEELRTGARPELNIRVQGGDILYVPRMRPENVYIIGDVKVPGAYTLPRHGTITAAQAVIYAGGPMPTAGMKNGFLMRHDEAGGRQAFPVDFAAILDGKKPDIPIRPNDIIYIPNSALKTIGVGMLNLVPRLLQQFLIF